MRTSDSRLLATAVCLLLGGCSESHGPADAGPGDDFLRAICAQQQRCRGTGLDAYRGSSIEGCVEVMRCLYRGYSPQTNACVTAIEEAPCEPEIVGYRDLPSPPCEVPANPKPRGVAPAATGRHCSGACTEGFVCTFHESLPPYCLVCQPGGEVGLGDECGALWSCPEGAYCDDGHTCRERAVLGEPCDWNECLSAYYCNPEGVCAKREPHGLCESSFHCPPGYLCRSGRCEAAPDLGDACDNDEDVNGIVPGLAGGQGCRAELACVDGRCVDTTACSTGKAGDVCSAYTRCAEHAVCDLYRGRCVTLPSEGEPCDPEYVQLTGLACDADLYCDSADQRCKRMKAVGDACGSGAPCANGYCDPDSQRCVSPGIHDLEKECRLE